MESFINTSLFVLEPLEAPKANGAVKLFQGKTCINAIVFGPFQSNYSKNYKRGSLEVVIRNTEEKDLKIQKSLEFSLANALESIIMMESYPGTLTKITLAILSDDGSLYSSLFNAAMIALLKNGISLKSTMFCYSLIINEIGDLDRVLYFPNKEEEQRGEIQMELVLDLFSKEILQIHNQQSIKFPIFHKIVENCQKENALFAGLIKSFLTSFS